METTNTIPATTYVAIDYTDDTQVADLVRLYYRICEEAMDAPHIEDEVSYFEGAMKKALRRLAGQTDVEEPTGLGAVVNDHQGRTWIRTENRPDMPWYLPGQCVRAWADVDAALVLSEGMEAL